jgi:hypothetical protein
MTSKKKLHAWFSLKQYNCNQKNLYYVTVNNYKCVQVTEVSENKYDHCYDDAIYLGQVFSNGIYKQCSEENRIELENYYKLKYLKI